MMICEYTSMCVLLFKFDALSGVYYCWQNVFSVDSVLISYPKSGCFWSNVLCSVKPDRQIHHLPQWRLFLEYVAPYIYFSCFIKLTIILFWTEMVFWVRFLCFIKIVVHWYVIPHSFACKYKHFEGLCYAVFRVQEKGSGNSGSPFHILSSNCYNTPYSMSFFCSVIPLISWLFLLGCAMAQVVSHWSITTEAWYQSQAHLHGIYIGQIGTGAGFPLSILIFACPVSFYQCSTLVFHSSTTESM